VEALCRRVIVIHHGVLLYDGDLAGLVARFAPSKTIVLDLERDAETPTRERLVALVGDPDRVVEMGDGRVTLRVPRTETAAVTSRVLSNLPVTDLVVEEPAVDEVIDRVFATAPGESIGESVDGGAIDGAER